MSQQDRPESFKGYLQTVDPEYYKLCRATWWWRAWFCYSHSVSMKLDDCLVVKWAAHLLAVNHGIDRLRWTWPIQHNSRTHPLAHEIRYCLETKIATPLTFYLLWDKIRLSGRTKCNTYFLPTFVDALVNVITCCVKVWLTLYWSWDKIWWTPLDTTHFQILVVMK